MKQEGLTSAEVAARVSAGKVNRSEKANTTTVPKIISHNLLTVFNLVNLILAGMILFVGSYKNLLFIFIAIANTLIGIINELRAKHIVDKMQLLSEQQPTVIRDGKSLQIPTDQLVEDDLMILSLGDQILVDAKVEQGTIEVNESLLTGEQDNIQKSPGDSLISGSFVVSGSCKARVTRVGNETFIAKLEHSAHHVQPSSSKLFTIINKIVKYISFTLIPIGILLLIARFRVPGTSMETAITSTVAALISMIPEGLVLLTSTVLALATIRLSQQKVLVQNLYSIETLARVDTICLDKTGTLTTGNMTVHDYTSFDKSFESVLASILQYQVAENATIVGLRKKFLQKPNPSIIKNITETISFSSDRKHSGIKTRNATYLLGAVEFVTDDKSIIKQVKDAASGYRTLAVIKKSTDSTPEENPSKTSSPLKKTPASIPNDTLLGFVRLKDEIRQDAGDIIRYFYDNNIDVKIISGDDLDSVKTIAARVGMKDLKGVNLSSETTHNYSKLVKEYNIFTRVKPSEKKELVKALKKQGSTVAMTGDGVNDILAMKEADCSMAIGEGADAARRSSQIVLLGNDFSTVPAIIAEGRRSINNLERSATLFLTKTTYAVILAVLFVFLPFEYPFSPIAMSLLNFLCIGFPGFVLALEPNFARVKDQFIHNIKHLSIPTGIIISLATVAIATTASFQHFPRPLLVTITIIAVFICDYLLLFRISRPFTRLRIALLSIILIIFLGVLLIPPLRAFFDFYSFF